MARLYEVVSLRDKLFYFIKDYYERNRYPPTIREICKAFKNNSTSHISYHIDILVDRGAISKTERIARSIVPIVSEYHDSDWVEKDE